MLVQRNAFAQLFNLQQLAFHHLLGQVNERVQHTEVALLHGDFEGLHVQPIAGQHAHGVAPLGVGGRAAAADLGLVNDVVMHQRGGMDDLHHRTQLDGAAPRVAKQLSGEQQQRRTNALAAAGAQILANIGDGAHRRHRVSPELALNGGQIFAQQLEDLFARYGGSGAHENQ